MSSEQHTHKWKYNEVEDRGWGRFTVVRFCTDCLFVEEKALKNEEKLGETNAS